MRMWWTDNVVSKQVPLPSFWVTLSMIEQVGQKCNILFTIKNAYVNIDKVQAVCYYVFIHYSVCDIKVEGFHRFFMWKPF